MLQDVLKLNYEGHVEEMYGYIVTALRMIIPISITVARSSQISYDRNKIEIYCHFCRSANCWRTVEIWMKMYRTFQANTLGKLASEL